MKRYTTAQQQAAIVAGFCFLAGFVLLLIALFGLLACTPAVEHRITVPQLTPALTALKPCPALPPIPDDVLIDIKGDKVTANAGGEALLRAYVSAYSRSKAAH